MMASLLRLLAQATPPAATGLEPTYFHRFPLPAGLTLLVVVASIALVLVVLRKRRSLVSAGQNWLMAGLRVGLILVVVLMIYGWMRQQHVTDLPDLVILLDESTSMKLEDNSIPAELREQWLSQLEEVLGDVPAGRFQLAQTALLANDASLLRELAASHHIKLFSMADGLRPMAAGSIDSISSGIRQLTPVSQRSRLGAAIQQLLKLQRGRPTTAIVVLTDGSTTEGPSIAEVSEESADRGIPLFLVGIGTPAGPLDLTLQDLVADRVAFVEDLVTFDLRVTATGLVERQSVTVELRQVGSSQLLGSAEIELGGDLTSGRVRLSHRVEQPGEQQYQLRVTPLEGESDQQNNNREHRVLVRDEAIRVLLVQEYPNFEFRLLRDMLGRLSEQAGTPVELVTVLQEADADAAAANPRFLTSMPVSRDELFEFDVVVFGDVNPQLLGNSVLDNLAEFVSQRGGGLVLLAGPRHMPMAYRGSPLEGLVPFSLEGSELPPDSSAGTAARQLQLASQGEQLPHLVLGQDAEAGAAQWQAMPPCFWLLEAGPLRDGVRVLVESPRPQAGMSPVVTLQFVGAGKVIFHATDESWRWRGNPAGEQLYQRYWLQTLRYLSRHQLLGRSREAQLTSDRETYAPGEVVRLRTRFLDEQSAPADDAGVLLVVQRENAYRRLVTLNRDGSRQGHFLVSIPDLAAGRYRAWLASPQLEGDPPDVRFSVQGPRGEDARPGADLDDLGKAASRSGGALLSLSNVSELPRRLPDGRQVRIQSRPPRPIWNSPWLAWLFVVLIGTEWILRKRLGLV